MIFGPEPVRASFLEGRYPLVQNLHAACAALLVAFASVLASGAAAKETSTAIRLWPGAGPGSETWSGPEVERKATVPGVGTFQVVTNVSTPTLTVVRPAEGSANGTAVIVCPGGGFSVLAWDMEGLEIARWLADRGITAFVLKYRVRQGPRVAEVKDPADFDTAMRTHEVGRLLATLDALQATRLVRSRANEFGIDPHKVGMMGFSAGAVTTMGAVLNNDPESRPDFAAPIYGAAPELAIPASLPPLFIAAAQDDKMVPASKSIEIFNKWTSAGGRAELHLYEQGGHGFGMRQRSLPVDDWRGAFEQWLLSHGLIKSANMIAP